MNKSKLNVLLLFVIIVISITFMFNEIALSQYDKDQIDYVSKYLKDRKLLGKLTELTNEDAKQSATRADVLFACYLVIRRLEDNTEISALNQNIKILQEKVYSLENRGGRTPSEDLLIKKVLDRVKRNLQISQKPVEINKDINDLNKKVEALGKLLVNTSPRKIERMEGRIHDNRIIASASVVLSLLIAIFAAR